MFRPYKIILRPSKKTDPRVVYVSLHCGITNSFMFLLEKCKIHCLYILHFSNKNNSWICLLGGPEDDLIRSKHVALTKKNYFCI